VGCTNTRLERTSITTSPSRNDSATTFVDLHNADVPVKAGQNTDRTDRESQIEYERAANHRVLARSVLETAVGNRSSAGGTITAINRTKVLQISTLRTVRSMRAILCDVLPSRLTPLPSPQVSRID
jgi:hypothetical protein